MAQQPTFQNLVLQSGNSMQTALRVTRHEAPAKRMLQNPKGSEEVLEILKSA